MERGAGRFFADLPEWERREGSPEAPLGMVLSTAVRALERHPHCLRLLIVCAAQPPAAGDGQVQEVVGRVRGQALRRLRAQIAIAFGDDPDTPTADQLARFMLAAIDGAVVAVQADRGAPSGDQPARRTDHPCGARPASADGPLRLKSHGRSTLAA